MIDFNNIKNVYDFLYYAKKNSSDKIAIVDDKSSIRYSELLSEINDTISKLRMRGFMPKDRVVLYGDTTIRWVVVFLSLMSMGVIVIPLNPFFDTNLIIKYIKYADVKKAIFGDTAKVKCDVELKSEIIKNVDIKNISIYSIDDIIHTKIIEKEESNQKTKITIDENSTSLMIFTSGTESEPKLTCLTQKNIISSLDKLNKHFADILHIGGDKCMIAIPLNHIYGIIILIQTLLYSYTAYITDTLHPQNISDIINKNDIKSLYSVALIFDALCASPIFEKCRNLLTANFISGSKLTKERFENYKKSYRYATFFNIYGTTEATGAISVTEKKDYDSFDNFSKGKILIGYDVAIYKDGIYNKRTGINGEIVFKSDTMLKEYYNIPKDKSNIDANGWFHTGDIGILLAENRLEIIGRIKDIIIKGGENISVLEIENELLKYDCIDKVAVVPKADEKYGEEIYAYVTLKNKKSYDEGNILESLKKSLGSFKVPKKIIVLDTMPLNTLGKVIKSELKKEKVL